MNKILLIIDAQYDFINGSLAVNGAEDKMIKLAEYIKSEGKNYDCIIMTADWHPSNHCSFIEYNGEWPKHCVQYTAGAAIYQPIIDAIDNSKCNSIVLEKGTTSNKEEYSVMDNYFSSKSLIRLIDSYSVEQIDVCGIANEYCVFNTVKDLNEKYNLGSKLNILINFVAAIKDESVLINYANNNNLKIE